MFNPNKITKNMSGIFTLAGVATVYLIGSSNVFAETVSDATATVTIQNAFTLVETTPINFGTLRAFHDQTGTTNIASLILTPAGTSSITEVGTAKMTSLVPATPGLFSVTGAAPFTDLTVVFPAAITKLVAVGAPGTSPDFQIAAAGAGWAGTIEGGANDGAVLDTTTFDNLQTDVNGEVALNVGATLTTDVATTRTTAYIDAAYTATYSLEIKY
jgi:hypothetical protein